MKIIKSATLQTIQTKSVDVEATFTNGLPSFTIVGLASNIIQESRDRVKSALLTNDFKFPAKKITINLSPSEIQKSGTHFDLAIALIIALYESKVNFEDFYVFGELSLDGKIKDCSSIFPLVLSLAKQNLLKNVIVCSNSAKKLSKIPNINIYSVDTLSQAIDFFKFDSKEKYLYQNESFDYESIKIHDNTYYYINKYEVDFAEVKGQDYAINAALIAAAGNHNILFEGSAGCGKSMISKRLRYILPPMSLEEILEKAKLQAIDYKDIDFSPLRVFRNPHHSSTKSSLFGGGSGNSARIGEVALSNAGVLFFDEFPHFSKSSLEALREPLEDYKVLISRVNSKVLYDTKFLFVAAMNPCPCGNLLSKVKECRCSDVEIQRYKNRLSEPLLDRIDLYVTMQEPSISDKTKYSSKQLHQKVIDAFILQKRRKQNNLNGKLSDKQINQFCKLDSESEIVLQKAISNFNLSFRSINKVLKVARTIADLNANENITKQDLMQSLSYRKR
ncbi:Fis family transcriptional regulator [Arcobacter sp. CECT 8986]|uniref:YifB family Mg chelatase-like AAA ATPase n=1 Tax=Arcobacter sp. CECT 8986 TaxID=2044507 RepID=UPI001009E31A|nr:YifB family Mg chelatase-like AAA ATPase [Arcobacter sp. CECT 8986]RXJ99491.1 Fis family transcriptional regulator [Arcobacter sp. CECT 8986]